MDGLFDFVKPESILQLLLVRATEESDPGGEVISWAEREGATREALRTTGEPADSLGDGHISGSQWRFLAERAGFLHERTRAMVAEIPLPLGIGRVGLAVCGVALVVGWISHGAGLSRSFDLVAGPFLLVLIWNTIIYALLAFRFCVRSKPGSALGLVSLSVKRWIGAAFGKGRTTRAGEAYAVSVVSWLRPWVTTSVVSWLHAGSACFTLGLLAAIYFRGLSTGYLAGWESTWLGPEGVKLIVGTLLGPASAVSGIPLPESVASWAQMERGPGYEGVKAAPWIHLYALTLVGWVILPRAVLSAASHLRAKRLQTTPPAWTSDEPYVRGILSLARQDGDFSIAILPFGFRATNLIRSGAFRDCFERLIRETWGQGARPFWFGCSSYGSEDAVWEGAWLEAVDCDGAALLFDAHSTPEQEVHGAVLKTVLSRLSKGRGGVIVVLECEQFNTERLGARLKLWQDFAQQSRCRILTVNNGIVRDRSMASSSLIYRNL